MRPFFAILTIQWLLVSGIALANEPLAVYAFTNGSLEASQTNALVSASPFQISSGTLSTATSATAGFVNPPFATARGWTETDIASAKSFFIDLSVEDGFQFDLTGFTFRMSATNSGPSAAGLQIGDMVVWQQDVVPTDAFDVAVTATDLGLVGDFNNLTSIRIRILGWLNESRTTTGGGDLRLDDLVINGTIRSVNDAPALARIFIGDAFGVGVDRFQTAIQRPFDGNLTITNQGVLVASGSLGELDIHTPNVVLVPYSGTLHDFNAQVTELTSNTRYRYRAFAENEFGIAYSDIKQVSTRYGFDGGLYRQTFSGLTAEGLSAEWSFSDNSYGGNFGFGTAAGLRGGGNVLGYQQTSANSTFSATITLQNTTGAVISSLAIGYNGRAERQTLERTPGWIVYLNGQELPQLAYSTAAGNRSGIQTVLSDLNIADGESFELRWTTQPVSGSGSYRQIGISDFHVGSPTSAELHFQGDAGWRMLAAPLWYMPSAVLAQISPIQGFAGDGFDRNLYTGYDGTGWTPTSDNSTSVAPGSFQPGQGILYYVFNNDTGGSNPLASGITLSLNGIHANYDVTRTLHSNGDKWNFLGNPFPQALDVAAIQSNGTIAQVVQIWQDAVGESVDGQTVGGHWVLSSSPELNGRIPPGSGFMLHNSDATELILPANGQRTGEIMGKDNNVTGIFMELWSGSILVDKAAGVVFSETGENGPDNQDLPKLGPIAGVLPGIAFIQDTPDGPRYLAQDARPIRGFERIQIPIEVSLLQNDVSYSLRWPHLAHVPNVWDVSLHDAATGETTNLREQPYFEFTTLSTQEEGIRRFDLIIVENQATSVEHSNKPSQTLLMQNYPNPFNPVTQIVFNLAETGWVTLEIFDTLGRQVAMLKNETMPVGEHIVSWDASALSSGIYLYRLQTGAHSFTKAMLLLK